MRILYHNPTCGSGIEQIGYIFLLLLKKLGHEIDLWNTQCANQQENFISKTVGNYDMVFLNAAHKLSFDRIIKSPADNIFNISHDGTELPVFCKQLSLNYLHQYQFLPEQNARKVIFPLTYPYAYDKREYERDRPYKFVYAGRWCEAKFHPSVKKFMEENKIKMDFVFVNIIDDGYSPDTIAKTGFKDANVGDIAGYLRKTEYLLVPSTTECITLVAGEALVNGCIPIVLETEQEEHKQFINCITAYSPEEFNNVIATLAESDTDPEGLNRKKVFDFSNQMWSIDKTLDELRTIFGTGNNGKINVIFDDNAIAHDEKGLEKTLPYINATIITGETIA
ncbi:MAG: hypothetical protein WC565_02670 [Parcubacteria group bacterium]